MPTLRNPCREKFALVLSEAKSASLGYIDAGYKPSRQNAARVMTNDDIRARVAELQAEAAKQSVVTLESIIAELADAGAVAKSKGQAQKRTCGSQIVMSALPRTRTYALRLVAKTVDNCVFIN